MRSTTIATCAAFLLLLVWPLHAIDDSSKYSNTGNINLTISNYGTFGDGFQVQFPDDQPSCEYPVGSHVEHMFDGGLWIGVKLPDGQTRVTTGAVDVAYLSDVAAGFEFTNSADPLDVLIERSSLLDSRYYHPEAVSHQDFIANYTDSNTVVPGTSITIPDHTPMNVSVHMQTYAWNYPFADAFVIFNYTIKNTSRQAFNNIWLGLWADLVVRNVSITPPRIGTPFYQHVGNGWVDSLDIAYAYDYDGDPGFTESYVGLKLLGVTPQSGDSLYEGAAHMHVWAFRNTSDPVYFSPQNDRERYEKMSVPLTPAQLEAIYRSPSNRMTLISTGPFQRLDPDSSMNIVFAVVCAKKYGNDPNTEDTELAKRNLYSNSYWAQTAYNGEDRNGNGVLDTLEEDLNANGILDEGEDVNGNGVLDRNEDLDDDGVLDRYILPTPPVTPRVKVVAADGAVTLYWDARAEESIDFITGKKDFEGYRIYRSRLYEDLPGRDLLSSMIRIAEYDSVDAIGYDTGFDLARLPEPAVFIEPDETGELDTLVCRYRFENDDLHSGWQYAYAVTAYDTGDPSYGLSSLESSRLSNVVRSFPGASASSQGRPAVTVYPNPYVVHAMWDGGLERERKLYFRHLPARCRVKIFTIAGDLVDSFDHDAETYDGSGIRWFDEYSKADAVFSGGEHGWDLISSSDQAIATGLYLYTVEDRETGDVQRGRFLVIK
ncbi:MAG: hypothetical protein MUE60_13915 [Candidatus Eisenbacteria bacterium]|nr:hypothetical protein [Candidatus Eisenbacteria bacterium]